jgi:hypothetical protein
MYNLDVDSPEKVLVVLRDAAQSFYESAGELESAWQDKNAGKPWILIAKELERASDNIERKLPYYLVNPKKERL